MNNQLDRNPPAGNQGERAARRRPTSLSARLSRVLLTALLGLAPLTALAEVVPVGLDIPLVIGRDIETRIGLRWQRMSDDAADSVLTVQLPLSVQYVPPTTPGPHDCSFDVGTRIVSCTVPAGAEGEKGSLGFSIKPTTLGSLPLSAQSSSSSATASNNTTVFNAGNLTVDKVLVTPANGEDIGTGGPAIFELRPSAVAGDAIPAGAELVVIDELPGNTGNVLESITHSGPVRPTSCTTVAAAQASRRIICTYTGPFSAADFNNSKITVGLRANELGTHTNNAAINSANENYFDIDLSDNADSAGYSVVAGIDVAGTVTFPAGPLEVNTPHTLTLTYQNNGPGDAPAGGTLSTIIPQFPNPDTTSPDPFDPATSFGFDPSALPPNCSAQPNQTLVVNGVTHTGTLVSCQMPAVPEGSAPPTIQIPLTTPTAGSSGSFPVVATPPAGLKDWNTSNNAGSTPYKVNEPSTDITLAKSKNPGSGPISPGSPITSTFTVANGQGGTSGATYSATNPLVVVDYLRAGEYDATAGLTNVTPGWTCVAKNTADLPAGGSLPAGITAASHPVRVECTNTGPGVIAKGGSVNLSFTTQATAITGQQKLDNYACSGASALLQLGLQPNQGPLPADKLDVGGDCKGAGNNLILTDVVSDKAWVGIRKHSSVDNTTWVDDPTDNGALPVLAADRSTAYWKIVVTTASLADNPNQKAIPTLVLTDQVPGVLGGTHSGSVTPSVIVRKGTATVDACKAGANQICTFTNVSPDAEIEVVFTVTRGLLSGLLTNHATLTSPNAVLNAMAGSQLSDAAALKVVPRTDYEVTRKTMSAPSMGGAGGAQNVALIGEKVRFTLTTRNNGPDKAPLNDFVVTDTLQTDFSDPTQPTYELLSVTPVAGGALTCDTAPATLAAGRVICRNTRGEIASETTQSIEIIARIRKPTPMPAPGAGGVIYPNARNTAHVEPQGGICQWRQGGSTPSTACDDAGATSNDSDTVPFQIIVPEIDLIQGKTQIYPKKNPADPSPNAERWTEFAIGEELRYRLTVQNTGYSRAEKVKVLDRINVPAPLQAVFSRVENINAAGSAPGGSMLKPTSSVVCMSSNGDLSCVLEGDADRSFLDHGEAVTFEVVFTVTGTSSRPVIFENAGAACADETLNYEKNGTCDLVASGLENNNLSKVNDVAYPVADLKVVSKTTVTGGSVNIGQPIEYRIVVVNNAGSTVEKMRVVDTLPMGFEWVLDDTRVVPGAGSGATLSGTVIAQKPKPATGTDNVCYLSAGPAELTASSQQQSITCDLGGMFPSGAANTVELTLFARAVPGVFKGPYGAANLHTNNVKIQPGRDANDKETSKDRDSTNNDGSSTTSVVNAQLGGRVFVDLNDNGDQDGTAQDTGIANVTVVLSGTDIYGNVVSLTTTTNSAGDYAFVDLVPSDATGYTLTQTQPAGHPSNGLPQPNTAGRPNRAGSSTGVTSAGGAYGIENTATTSIISGIVLAQGAQGVMFDFPEPAERRLSGHVYIDQDGSRTRTPADADIANATVALLEVETRRELTTQTNAQGLYEFTGLSAGKTYRLREPLPTTPAGLINQPKAINPGLINGVQCVSSATDCIIATDAGGVSHQDEISGIRLIAGNGTEFNFGENLRAHISGTVYLDRNDDGSQQAGETGIADVVITLEVQDEHGTWVPVVTTTPIVTDGNGNYRYEDAVIGANYRITETQPTGLGDGKENTSNVITITQLPVSGSTGNNFGEKAAVLSGVVYLDSNNNGTQEPGEPGLEGVTLSLPASVLNALGVANLTAITDADGHYQFTDLLAGSYTVTQQAQQPLYGGAATHNGITTAGSTGGTATPVTTVPSAISDITLAAGGKSQANNFGEVLVAGISGTVYLDRNDNGQFDGADAGSINSAANGGIAGVSVSLYAADGSTLIATVNTDGQGNYAFADLPTGVDYVVKQTQPDGYADGKENISNSITISRLPVAGSAGNNFGELLGALAGVVYEDFSSNSGSNNNGIRDAGEKGIAGVKLTLTGTDALGMPVSRMTTTDGDGAYRFDDLLQGSYVITEAQPTGYENGKHGAGSAGGDASERDVVSAIVLKAGQHADGYLFGELKKAPISGIVYLDHDDNGSRDPTEPGMPGVEIVITSHGPDGKPGGGDDISVSLTTDSDGSYSWPDALPGVDYVITQTQPKDLADGKENTSNVITITQLPVAGSTANNFGEKAAVLSGVVYLDSNNNGTQEPGEPGLEGVTLSLPASVLNALGVANLTAITDADGRYQFADLLAGSYTVTQQAQQPLHNGVTTINGITTVGSTGGAATPVTTVPSAISDILLAAGGNSQANNFGEVLQVAVSGTVFLDMDNDGAIAASGESGLAGVVIELTGTDDTGASVTLSTSTDKDGKFSFENLRPGIYMLVEPTQPTGTANGITTAGTVGGSASGTATPVTTVPSAITDIDLRTPGSASVDNLFGEIPRSSGISGKVWMDANNDGVVDPGEEGIVGVTVELTGTAIDGTPVSVTVTTDADGNYSFTDLPPGTYTVIEPNQPPGTLDGQTVPGTSGGMPTTPGNGPSKISTITVGVNQISTDNNFGEILGGSISGHVYNDSNDDGIRQSDEGGYAQIDVVLTGTDDLGNAVTVTGRTDSNGHYVFEGLRPGTYTVTEPTQPAETLNGLTTAGTIAGTPVNATVTDKATTPSAITGIVLQPGDKAIDNNFGEIGDSPDMMVSKSSGTVKFTVNNVASYTIRVRNAGQKPSFGEYIVRDRLPVGLTLAEAPTGNGWRCTGAVGDARFECRSSEVLAAGASSSSDITVKVNVAEDAAKAGTVNNAVLVEGGGENEFRTPTPTERESFEGEVGDLPLCDAAITQNACRVQNQVQLAASVGGTVWFDIGSDDALLDGGDERLHAWQVELVDPETGSVVNTTQTGADGSYRFDDVVPGQKWHIQFRDPMSGVLWAWPVNNEVAGGTGVQCDTDGALANGHASACRTHEHGASQLQVVLKPGDHLPQQSLPVDPSGVVYDATTRDPVPGSVVTLTPVGVCNGYDPLTAVLNASAGGYTVEGNAISMTVGNTGYYQFVFGPAAPARCEFKLTVTPPGGYQFVSSMIPPQDGTLSPPGAVGSNHLVQPQATAPTGAVGTATQYWLTLFSGSATAGIIHNHIPLDTAEATGLVISKTGDRQTAEIGDTVQYTITVRHTAGSALATVNILDTLPRGFTYIDGTARVGGRALDEPLGRPGPRLGFDLGGIDVGGQLVLRYRVRVGVGAMQGDGVNRAQAHGCSITGGCIDPVGLTPVPGSVPSNRAEYRVRVTGGVFTDEACVLGKVFVDCNNNHVQDHEELGIPGVRLYFSNGTWLISDSEGKYSYCGLTPQSHTLKVDASTLPTGARLTTSSNRNLGDADSLLLDLKNGELHRADFIEGSCSNPLLEQVKARRTQGEVRAPETEAGQSPLRFESKPARAPQQATDTANQRPIVHPRPNPPSAGAAQEVQP